jgi:small subunit ribosomal protein S17
MPRRVLQGVVVSDKMDKTVTVKVERKYMHPVYKKYLRMTDKYAAHDENNAFKVGDQVEIEECRPLSKRKKWTVISKPTGEGRPARVTAKQAAEAAAPKKEKAAKPAKEKTVKAEAAEKPVKAEAKKPAAKKAPAKKEK